MVKLRFLGVAGYEIVDDEDRHIVIDPFLDGQPGSVLSSADLENVDLICVTHAAPDHYGDTFSIARRTGARVVCGADVKAHLLALGLPGKQVTATCWNIRVEVAGIVVHPLECHHWSHIRLPDGQYISGVPMAFLIHVAPGIRFYHYGDTALFSDLKLHGELYRPTHGAIGITQPTEILSVFEGPDRVLTGEMDPQEGWLASRWLGLQTVFPCHYIEPDNADVRVFQELVRHSGVTSIVLRPGQWTTLEPVFETKSSPHASSRHTGSL